MDMMQRPRPAPSEAPPTLDVGRALYMASHRLSLKHLAERGKTTVSLLSKARIAELIHRVLRELVARARAEAQIRRQQQEEDVKSAVERLRELVIQYQETAQAKAELEGSRQTLLTELDEVRGALAKARAKALLPPEDALDTSPFQGIADFDRHVACIVSEVTGRRITIGEDCSRKDAERLEARVKILVANIVREERRKVRVPPPTNQDLWRMERRVEKLYAELDRLENALKLISSSKVQNSALVQNLLRQLGVVSDDKNYEKKREMLKVVLDTNRQIRKDSRDLAAQGISLSSPRGPRSQ